MNTGVDQMGADERVKGFPGGAILAGWVTGVFGLVGACFGAVTMNWVAAGVCLIAAAIAFSGVSHAILRK